jgi:CheY-like chemotaxis protein
VELAREHAYDVILMDVQMPEMNGHEATRAILVQGGLNASTPIIAMTANVMEAELHQCREAGMIGHIPKPFSRDELCSAIDRALMHRNKPSNG